ncbi:hypothetical protein [Protaetiibacter mangrovi]|uniref:Uncharacterized protein n=1 Tax=Protaetiibacter mangrovi TaxID=2970926 RepID=A0ABT1ZFB4_9MICO|nr:hypothetical protein [Protaetiibacter mangrovi]MCS0499397.1 hypothetical protein [Protaetiibacter mangrovi]TPX04759.1 hypothetical protein FJ656_10150 [Schumannella luteola]
MIRDILGEWDISQIDRTKKTSLGRIAFLERDGRVVVVDTDPDGAGTAARVEFDGAAIRFELLSAGSSRGNAHYTYEISLHGPYAFGGTRRRGLLAKTPITGERVGELAAPAPAAWAPPVVAPSHAGELSSDFSGMPGSLAEAKARAAEAAERAALAAAEAEAAQAEVEAAAALENARRAAERAAAARAAVAAQAPATPTHPVAVPVTEEALAALPAPTEPPAITPGSRATAAPHAAAAMRVTHRLSGGGSTIMAVEVFPDVFVWGESYATTDRLRGIGWSASPIDTDERIEVAARLLQQATLLRDSLAS